MQLKNAQGNTEVKNHQIENIKNIALALSHFEETIKDNRNLKDGLKVYRNEEGKLHKALIGSNTNSITSSNVMDFTENNNEKIIGDLCDLRDKYSIQKNIGDIIIEYLEEKGNSGLDYISNSVSNIFDEGIIKALKKIENTVRGEGVRRSTIQVLGNLETNKQQLNSFIESNTKEKGEGEDYIQLSKESIIELIDNIEVIKDALKKINWLEQINISGLEMYIKENGTKETIKENIEKNIQNKAVV